MLDLLPYAVKTDIHFILFTTPQHTELLYALPVVIDRFDCLSLGAPIELGQERG